MWPCCYGTVVAVTRTPRLSCIRFFELFFRTKHRGKYHSRLLCIFCAYNLVKNDVGIHLVKSMRVCFSHALNYHSIINCRVVIVVWSNSEFDRFSDKTFCRHTCVVMTVSTSHLSCQNIDLHSVWTVYLSLCVNTWKRKNMTSYFYITWFIPTLMMSSLCLQLFPCHVLL